MELFDLLTKNGNDFNVHMATYWGGTSIKINFSGVIISDVLPENPESPRFVDDSPVQGIVILNAVEFYSDCNMCFCFRRVISL